METNFNTIEEALEDLRQGRIIVVTDDPDRENEGDLICAGKFATTENVNFMATYGKGLICMPMTAELAHRLDLKQMVVENTDNHSTAFTVSIDHISTTTGISAVERSVTALKCADPDSRPEDFRRPGHMFPLTARKGGVLIRSGHTEATVDLVRIAGLGESGLCCEIMKDDGTMMRTAELFEFARLHGLAQGGGERLAELFVQGHGHLGARGADVAGAVALAGGGVQGELADDQQVAPHVEHGAVHHALGVVEHAQVHYLVRQPVDVFLAVAVFYAHQYEQPAAYGGLLPMADFCLPPMVTEAWAVRWMTILISVLCRMMVYRVALCSMILHPQMTQITQFFLLSC